MKNGVVAGIDLGTNNSCIAVYKFDKAEVLAGADGSRITPSVVYITETGEKHVGKSAKNYGHKKPERCFYDIKRFFAAQSRGEFYKKYKDHWTFEMKRDTTTGYCNYLVDKKEIVSYVDEHIDGVVLTVPAYFSSEQKNKVLEAAKLADLQVFQLICEPTAAAIAYRMEHSYINGETLFVFDMGGGKTDGAIIKINNNICYIDFTVMNIRGDPHLGSRDFDVIITKWMLKEMESQIGKIELTPALKYKLMEMAEEAKEALSIDEDTKIQLSEIKENCKDISLTREMFEDLSKAIIEKIKVILQGALKAQNKCQIDHVLLIGGSTKIPMVKNLLKEFFPEATFSNTVNSEYLVAEGAAKWAAKLGHQSTQPDIANLNIQDVTSPMIGTEVFENGETKFRKVFDSITPYGKEEIFTMVTTEDDQKRCEIPLYEGLSDYVTRNNYIGSIIIEKIPTGKAGNVKIDVKLKIDRNGILTIAAEEYSNCVVHYKTQFKSKKKF